MINDCNHAVASAIDPFGKGQPLKQMIPHHQQRSHPAQPVEQSEMGLRAPTFRHTIHILIQRYNDNMAAKMGIFFQTARLGS